MIGTIARHELQVYCRSAFAWIAAAALQLILGWLFLSATEQYTLLQNSASHAASTGLTAYLVVHFIAPASIIMMLATPLLCMNLIAAERQSGRYLLFASAPVTSGEIVLGKFIAAIAFQLGILTFSALLVSALYFAVPLDLTHLLSAYTGLALFVALATALTLLFSSMTRIPALAAFASFSCLLLSWMGSSAGTDMAIGQLSPSSRMHNFMQGLLHTGDLMYFVCLCALLLIVCSWRLGSSQDYRGTPV